VDGLEKTNGHDEAGGTKGSDRLDKWIREWSHKTSRNGKTRWNNIEKAAIEHGSSTKYTGDT
jgi:hypothetical protein